jgi:TolA-binding protein
LPQQKPTRSSKPGRRPAGASSLSRTTDGRIAKRSAATATAPSAAFIVSADGDDDDVDPEILDRRQRNNLAAKRYRQKKIDRIQELEEQVKEVTRERDDLRIRLARQEAEVAALREMLKLQSKSEGSKD